MCEAFIEEGLDITLLVPRRGTDTSSVRESYNLRVEVPLVRLPAIDLYNKGPFWYHVSSYAFMLVPVIYLWSKRLRGEQFLIYTVDLDNFSSSFLPLVGRPLYSEMHGGKPKTFLQKYLFAHLDGVIAINTHIVKELKERFIHSSARFIVKPNGVDTSTFVFYEKQEARKHLTIANDTKMVLYAGRFFGWKGLESLVEAATISPELSWYLVGGTKEYFQEVTGIQSLPSNMVFIGSRPHQEIPWWISAADALVVLGTKRDQQSYWYTSPMKLFEYLVSPQPVIASATPALQEIVTDDEVFLYQVDNAKDLAEKVRHAIQFPEESKKRILRAQEKGRSLTWKQRARDIKAFLNV